MDLPPPPSVPGFTLQTLVRFSRSGETWLALRQATGTLESLTLVRGGLVSAAEPLTTFRHPHVIAVTEVIAAGRSVALLSPVPGPLTVAALCVGRPVLDPGEVITIGLAMARVLAAAHDRGIVHGDLDPVDIAIDANGQPALVGLGVTALSGDGVAPADDVHALALILRSLLGDDTGPRAEAIRGALSTALSGHPAARPEAGELAGLLAMTCPPQPLRGLPSDGPTVPLPVVRPRSWAASMSGLSARVRHWHPGGSPRPGDSGRHVRARSLRPSTTAVTAALAVLGLLLLVLAAPLFGGASHSGSMAAPASTAPASVPATIPPAAPSPSAPGPSPSAPLSATQWQHTLQRLASARDAAFRRLDPAMLAEADAPGSSAAAIDAQRLSALAAARVHAVGLASTVTAVRVLSSGADAATVRFVEASGGYSLVDRAGVVIEHRPAAAGQAWSVTLLNTSGGWRTATATVG